VPGISPISLRLFRRLPAQSASNRPFSIPRFSYTWLLRWAFAPLVAIGVRVDDREGMIPVLDRPIDETAGTVANLREAYARSTASRTAT
jgi:hypothetical protein